MNIRKLSLILVVLLIVAVAVVAVAKQAKAQKEDIQKIQSIIIVETGPSSWTLEYHMADGSVRTIKGVEALVCATDGE
jgi:hypothetical protein